jgi:hypothetical protein
MVKPTATGHPAPPATVRNPSQILARICRSGPQIVASGRIQPHTRLRGKITNVPRCRRSEAITCGSGGWGGWDSNPGPADYESAALTG